VPQVGNPWLKEFSECPKVLCSCVISLSLPEIGCLVSLYALMYPSSQRSTWNKFIPAIRAPGKFTRVLCYFCHYVWGQHCCWTDTSIIGNDIFFSQSFHCPPLYYCPPHATALVSLIHEWFWKQNLPDPFYRPSRLYDVSALHQCWWRDACATVKFWNEVVATVLKLRNKAFAFLTSATVSSSPRWLGAEVSCVLVHSSFCFGKEFQTHNKLGVDN